MPRHDYDESFVSSGTRKRSRVDYDDDDMDPENKVFALLLYCSVALMLYCSDALLLCCSVALLMILLLNG